MQKWEYKVFASHLDPAELALLLDESGREGWELVAFVPVADRLPLIVAEQEDIEALDPNEIQEVIPVQAFRYVFKRPLVHGGS